MRQRSGAGSSKPRRRKAPAAKRRGRVETIRRVNSSATKEELRFALLKRTLSEARRHHRRAEEALRESEYKLRQIIDTVPSLVWAVEPDGENTYANRRILDYIGAPYEDFRNSGWQRFVQPDDLPETLKAFQHAIETETSYETVHHVRQADGEFRWHHTRGEPVRDREGRIIQWYGLTIDVDEAKKAEERLRRSEAYLAESQRISHTGSYTFSLVTRKLLYWSEECYRIWGFDPAQGLPDGEIAAQRIHPDHRERVYNEAQEARRRKRDYTLEFRIVLPDGTVKYVECNEHHLFSERGELVETMGTNVDVTERKRAEEALRRGEAWLAEAQRLSRTGTWVLDVTTRRFLYWSDESYRIWGFDPLQGLPTRDDMWGRIHPDDQDRLRNEVDSALREQRDFIQEFKILLPDGTVKSLEANTHHEFSPLGELLEVICTNVDVTDRKQAGETLRRGEAWLAQAQSLIHTGTWVLDGTRRRYLYWSDESYRIWGFDPLQGHPDREDVWGRIHPDDRERVWGGVQEALREKRDFLSEFRILLPDGTVKYLEINAHHEFSSLGELIEVICTNVDVTERKYAQDEHERLRQLETVLAHLNRVSTMGELAASLSHEILHPIATARNNARAGMRFLEMNPPNLDEAREALACVVRDADRAKDIIGRMRDHIKKAPQRKECFSLNEAINEVIVMVRSAIADNRVSVQTRLAEGALAIHGDRVQLQQVLLNLILNAVEAMGSVEAGARELLVSTEQDRTDVLVAVRDSGPGIDATHLERVFEAFYTTKSGGTGMGLLICRSIIDAHGGKLWAEANKPRGAVFQFSLPATQEDS